MAVNTGKAVATISKDDINKVAKAVATYQGTFERLLPSHVDVQTFIGCAAGAMFRNPDLAIAAKASPDSLIVALRDCARLGHQPGTDQYALTVRSGKIMGIEQYQGVIERMYRGGGVKSIHAHVVCVGETFELRDPNPPLHVVADWLDRDTSAANLKGAYAYATLPGGATSRVVAMGRAEIMRHRAVAATTNIWDGPFASSMWLKTVAHELEKWVSTSPEYMRERARVAAEAGAQHAAALPANVPLAQPVSGAVWSGDSPPMADVMEGEIVPDGPSGRAGGGDEDGWPETRAPGTARADGVRTGGTR
jgi:recombination protein RecT